MNEDRQRTISHVIGERHVVADSMSYELTAALLRAVLELGDGEEEPQDTATE